MRQPASIYIRSLRKTGAQICRKVQRRASHVLTRQADGRSKSQRESRALIDRRALICAFEDLGLKEGDAVLVHSGISHLGKVVGGPRVIFDLLMEQVGGRGHVLYPVFPFGSLMHSYLTSNPSFDARTAPSKMGALTDYAIGSGGMRSVHPTHSVLAFGPHSADFVGEHHLCTTPFADRSPFARLVEFGGKILLIGVGLNSTTSFHRTEDRLGDAFPVKVYRPEIFHVPCVDMEGHALKVSTTAHDPFISKIRDCDLLRPQFLRTKVLREVVVGSGAIGIIDSSEMDQLVETLWRAGRRTIYGRIWG